VPADRPPPLIPRTAMAGELPLRVIRPASAGPLQLRCRCGLSRLSDSDSALIRIAAHLLACGPGAAAASRDPQPLPGEQPVRLNRYLRKNANPQLALMCVCGAEATQWRWGSHSLSPALKTHFRRPVAGTDLTLDGLGQLLRHCGRCQIARDWATQVPVLGAPCQKQTPPARPQPHPAPAAGGSRT
jgi:hypothetical protein